MIPLFVLLLLQGNERERERERERKSKSKAAGQLKCTFPSFFPRRPMSLPMPCTPWAGLQPEPRVARAVRPEDCKSGAKPRKRSRLGPRKSPRELSAFCFPPVLPGFGFGFWRDRKTEISVGGRQTREQEVLDEARLLSDPRERSKRPRHVLRVAVQKNLEDENNMFEARLLQGNLLKKVSAVTSSSFPYSGSTRACRDGGRPAEAQ